MRIQNITLLFIGLLVAACNLPQTNQDKHKTRDTVVQNFSENSVSNDSLTHLLDKATKADSLEYADSQQFFFFKSGYFLDGRNKNALVIQALTDSTILVKLYSHKDTNWILQSTVENLDGPGPSFSLIFDDFNFDGQTDIYLQVTVSNGYSLSRGHLIIIDPVTLKLNVHHEARDLANMKPDKKTKSVISEEVIECNANLNKGIGKWTNQWVNGRLKTLKRDYSCEPLR